LLRPASAFTQGFEAPYFVAYDHHMQEVDNLEVSTNPVLGTAHDLKTFWGNWTEFEYGARKWWTTSFYLDWQHTQGEGSLFTGVRFENRFRPFLEEHRINPVLYVEYEHLNGGEKTIKEVVGFEGKEDLRIPNRLAEKERDHELETRLILSSQIGEWNLAENMIAGLDLIGHQWEFGYAAGLSRPLAPATGRRCSLCRERFVGGLEAYGGLGIWGTFTLHGTSHYIAPVIAWNLPTETTIRFSPGWGLTSNSVGNLFRFSVSQEVDDFGRRMGRIFRRH
jgi:hypothetical protein